jgi:hypothetical protein
MDRIDQPPRRAREPSESAKPRRASPWILLLVLGGVGVFLLLLSPLQKTRPPPPRPLQGAAGATGVAAERRSGGALQPTWQRAAPAAPVTDAGAR